MSKQGKRKISVELPKAKELANRPSVFERLGTKKGSSNGNNKKLTEHCRQWAQHGSCVYGKTCKFASTHTLISPSKQRAANKDKEGEVKRITNIKDDAKSRLHSTVVVRSGRSPDGEIDNWDQNDLEYADTDVLEKRRQQLQRELELQLKMDGKDMRKDKKKIASSSSSSRSSSSSSVTSSSSDGSSSSSSSGRDVRRKSKRGKLKRNSSSSSDGDVPKKKIIKGDVMKRDRIEIKKPPIKKDDRLGKKVDITKKKPTKVTLAKKSLSPSKKSGGTPPITTKSQNKTVVKKSPPRRERNRSITPHSSKDRIKEKDREKDKDREKEKERQRARSRSPRKARSRTPKGHASNSKDVRRKESSERSRPLTPKKQRRDTSIDKHRKHSASREKERGRDKDRSLERRKEKHDDKDRHDVRKDRGRDVRKDKREDNKRRGRERGLGGRSADKGLEKPSKPMERLLPRPEERLAALAAISNRVLETDKTSSTSKDRQDTLSDRGGRKQDRGDRSKRDRGGSMDREQGDYDMGGDRSYEHGHGMEHFDRPDDRYDDAPRPDGRSPGFGRDRRYDSGYDLPGPRNYPDNDDRMYDERGDHRDMGFDDRRPHRDRSWEGRGPSIDRGERGYMHPQKDWDGDNYRGPDGPWGRDRHWPGHDQMGEWVDKESEMEGWHHRGAHRGRMHDNYNRGMRMDGRGDTRARRRPEQPEPTKEPPAPVVPPSRQEMESEDKAIPDDLSEISDDPDDILNRDDMVDQPVDEGIQNDQPSEEPTSKPESSEKESTQDTVAAVEEKESQESKDDEDVNNLDFEEISDGELEEERTRAGLVDALGVDWASLVADVVRRERPPPRAPPAARLAWRPHAALARLGISAHMAGDTLLREIVTRNAQEQDPAPDENGLDRELDVESLHPVAAIQVSTQKRKRQRAALFGSGCEITRALSARRDLARRRHLCGLRTSEPPPARAPSGPALFQEARALFIHAQPAAA